jgi:3-oxoacyl-[acyl-carrier protein] reductase
LPVTDVAMVFGATGALGGGIARYVEEEGLRVVRVTRSRPPTDNIVGQDWVDLSDPKWMHDLPSVRLDRVIFAQGLNASGGIDHCAEGDLEALFEANVVSIVRWLRALRDAEVLQRPCRVVIVGSVWATVARPDKLAYVVSKSAVSGLVRSLCADLGRDKISVNAVLPGVVDTPMTRKFLNEEAILRLADETPTRELISVQDVARVAAWLASPHAHGICGQSIVLDNGWSTVRHV